MNTIVKKQVLKDAQKVPNFVKEQVLDIIKDLEKAENLYDIKNVVPMEGTEEPYFRITFGTYRLLVHYEKETQTVRIRALTHRKDSYKKQNLPWNK
jgi:mRNA-degrading endonuclease RelE of RelBE toxin-antitoxin system